jgi:hypothetical protein
MPDYDSCVGSVLQPRLAALTFTAQPSLAASYGLMQVMYATALDMNWQGANGKRNPSFLFDTPENLANGGGSLEPGSKLLTTKYKLKNKNAATFPLINSYSNLLQLFQKAYSAYNQGKDSYGEDVIIVRSPNHQPIPDKPLLGAQ